MRAIVPTPARCRLRSYNARLLQRPERCRCFSEEFDTLCRHAATRRRNFVRTSVGSGFAAAVLPVAAQTTIKTDTDGLVAGEVNDPGRRLQDAGLSRRAGRQGRTRRWCWWSARSSACTNTSPTSRGASPSWATSRSRPSCSCARAMRQSYGEIGKLIAEVVSQGARRAGHAATSTRRVAWAQGQGATRAQARHHRLLLGRAHHLAVRGAQPAGEGRRRLVRAAGRRDQSRSTRRHPVDVAGMLKAPVLGLYGGKDTGIPLDTVDADEDRAGRRQPGGASERVRRLSRCAACLPCRLPAELPQGRRRRRLGAVHCDWFGATAWLDTRC